MAKSIFRSESRALKFIGGLTNLIPLLWLTAVVFGLIESVTYRGFLLKHILFDPVVLYAFLAFVELFCLFEIKQKNNYLFKNFRKINLYLSVVLILIFASFRFIEALTYHNFIYSKIHINVESLLYPVILTVYTSFIFMSSKGLLLFLSAFLLINNISGIWARNKVSLLNMLKNPTASFQEKMETSLGKQFYNYVLFVKENTPENAKILLPPFPAYPWPQTGNIPYMKYFLYPRVLLNGEEYSSKYDLKKEGIDYVLIAWGETTATSGNYTHGWPKFDVDAEETLYQQEGKGLREEKGDYKYDEHKGTELWGIIKVQK